MRQQLVLSAVALLLMQLTISAGFVSKRKEDQQSIVNLLRELISDKNTKDVSRAGPGLTQAQKDAVVAKHNELRSGEGAADMWALKYNDSLAGLAQGWTDQCIWGHRPYSSYAASDYGFGSIGENLWATTGDSRAVPNGPIQSWFNEKSDYNYDENTCAEKKACGHYTQVVWAYTQSVGCSLTFCPTLTIKAGLSWKNAYLFACNYGEAGNYGGMQPYEKGPACSSCSEDVSCTNNLCNKSKKRESKEFKAFESLDEEMTLII